MPESEAKVINFINGAEILFYSPNFLKHLLKNAFRKKNLIRVEEAYFNLFISDFTFKTMMSKGLASNYSRDLIIPMSVDTTVHQFALKDFNSNPLKFICVARDVPHKNFAGTIQFCEQVQEL